MEKKEKEKLPECFGDYTWFKEKCKKCKWRKKCYLELLDFTTFASSELEASRF